MAFHKWMLKNRWVLHSDGEYYYKDNRTWPPDDVATEDELLEKFFTE